MTPRFATFVLTRELNMDLNRLTGSKLWVPAMQGQKKMPVQFSAIGEPFIARRDTGWKAVRVVSEFGATSVLLFEEHERERVSGILRLRREGKDDEN